jgi:hypothetical protein
VKRWNDSSCRDDCPLWQEEYSPRSTDSSNPVSPASIFMVDSSPGYSFVAFRLGVVVFKNMKE